ncbi:SulP family inorganic anion transporter [Aporhodopirellula aestuarii]|uniref:SulP family inorganic anion transporter n=1 Tax=Aporhodopirellula aestuarii TaxID=2950107 RepID=A0ABT0TZ36_9BACT|nr:SulP family inorganic anion transporter [Aporhodopirellula aestuarii]MCM2369503.1 SulP family inorganic anion transporter [Aporhodopirellula aestuarii]
MISQQETDQLNELGSNIKHDFLASIVVFLVALPLCMGIAIASGVPVAAGLISGIVGGLVVGTLAGCPLQVSGPAAGLTVIVYEVVQRFGLEMLGTIVLIAGLLQAVAGILKLGQWFRAVSPAVIKGMLAGIGVLIFASQFHVMVDDKPKGSGLQNLITIPQAIWKGLAIPELNGREDRIFRTEMLRTVGDLRRRQVNLHEQVAERVPHPFDARERESSDSFGELASLELADLASEQAQITQDLIAVNQRLQECEKDSVPSAKSTKINEAAALAIRQSGAAAIALQQNNIAEILPLQAEATTSLELLISHQKNHHLAAYLGILTIAVILLWQGFAPKPLKVVPAPLIAVVLATLIAALLAVPVLYVEIPNNLWSEVRFPSLSVLNGAPWVAVFQAGLMIAVVASAETLLCATAVDQMHQGRRTRYDRELFAQGVGNVVCGFLGALPLTGVIVRSSANVQAGARTRVSAILHGLWLLIFVAGLAFVLRLIPTASLAAILVYTGYKLVNPKSIRDLGKYGRGEVAIYAATVSTIVITDLLTGVLVGIGLAAAKLLYTFSHLATELAHEPGSRKVTLSLQGAATFVRLPVLARELEKVPARAELHIEFSELDYIDHACLDLLMNWAKQHESTGGKLVLDWESLHARFNPVKAKNGGSASESVVRPDESVNESTAP